LRQAGARRYVLKYEASNPVLYRQIKPTDTLDQRLRCLDMIIEAGYQTGTGNIVGMPNQTPEDLVSDLLMLGRFKLAMSSTTVFIPGEKCAYCDEACGDLDITLNFLALIRILYPDRLIPTTSSLEKVRTEGQYLGLMAGANTVTCHDGTPEQLKPLFPIYSTRRFTPGSHHLFAAVAKAGLHPAQQGLIHAHYR
jgi:biotin synthase